MWNPQVKKITVSQKYSNVPTSLSGTTCKSNDKYTQKEGSVIYCWSVTHWIIFGPCNAPFNGRPTCLLQVLAWLYPIQVILAEHSYCLLKFLILDHLLYTSTSCGWVQWSEEVRRPAVKTFDKEDWRSIPFWSAPQIVGRQSNLSVGRNILQSRNILVQRNILVRRDILLRRDIVNFSAACSCTEKCWCWQKHRLRFWVG